MKLATAHVAPELRGVAHADTPKPVLVPPAAAQGQDFIGDAKLLFRIAACGGSDAVDDKLEKIVERHCKAISEQLDKFRALYFVKGAPFFDEDRAEGCCRRPSSIRSAAAICCRALVAFPDATEITTISLELAGDPRRIEKLTPNAARAQPRRAARARSAA